MEPEAHEPTTVSQRLMDIFVFAPAGLVVTAVEEFPRLVERGRERVTGRVTSARTVGSFAVSAGRHRLRQRADDLRHDRESAGAPVPDEPDSPATAVLTREPNRGDTPRWPGGAGRVDPEPVGQSGERGRRDGAVGGQRSGGRRRPGAVGHSRV